MHLSDASKNHAPNLVVVRQSLVRILESRVLAESLARPLTQKYWTIHGVGSIGEKAQELLIKTPAILESGFSMNERVVLAMGFFEAFYARNGILRTQDYDERHKRIMSASFTVQELETLAQISERFRGKPIAIRSSAHGDAKGTGVYESLFTANSESREKNAIALGEGIKKVLASQFTENAVSFRKELGIPEGMAVMIEQAVGNFIGKDFFAPNYSGLGITSLPGGGRLIKLVSGMPTRAVQSTGAIRIILDDSGQIEMLEDSHLYHENRFTIGETIEAKKDTLDKPSWAINSASDVLSLTENLPGLFGKMARLEALCGCPQYTEWAGAFDGSELKVTILQTADIMPKKDYFEFPKTPKNILASSDYVVGSTQTVSRGLVVVNTSRDIPHLRAYNKTHQNYVVAYKDDLMRMEKQLSGSDVSNASAVIELPLQLHGGDPIQHWLGELDTRKKVFLISNLDPDLLNIIRDEGKRTVAPGSTFSIYDVSLRVTASEMLQRALIELLP